jgi:hypothetical protein
MVGLRVRVDETMMDVVNVNTFNLSTPCCGWLCCALVVAVHATMSKRLGDVDAVGH